MPEMTLLGWFHTIIGVGAVLTGFHNHTSKYKVTSLEEFIGRLHLLLTLIVAVSASGNYNQGGFGIAHILAVLTLDALLGGVIMEKENSLDLSLNIFRRLVTPAHSCFI